MLQSRIKRISKAGSQAALHRMHSLLPPSVGVPLTPMLSALMCCCSPMCSASYAATDSAALGTVGIAPPMPASWSQQRSMRRSKPRSSSTRSACGASGGPPGGSSALMPSKAALTADSSRRKAWCQFVMRASTALLLREEGGGGGGGGLGEGGGRCSSCLRAAWIELWQACFGRHAVMRSPLPVLPSAASWPAVHPHHHTHRKPSRMVMAAKAWMMSSRAGSPGACAAALDRQADKAEEGRLNERFGRHPQPKRACPLPNLGSNSFTT